MKQKQEEASSKTQKQRRMVQRHDATSMQLYLCGKCLAVVVCRYAGERAYSTTTNNTQRSNNCRCRGRRRGRQEELGQVCTVRHGAASMAGVLEYRRGLVFGTEYCSRGLLWKN